jgi:hypothetical protein
MEANFIGHRLCASAALSASISRVDAGPPRPHARGLRLKDVHLLTLQSFDKGIWQSTTNSWNFEGKPKCKHFDSPSGATGEISQSTTSFAYYIWVWALLSLESLLRASSALVLFECERYCSSNRFFGPAAPWYYSSQSSTSPRGFESGDSNLSKLTECFCGYAINWDPAWVSGRLCQSPSNQAKHFRGSEWVLLELAFLRPGVGNTLGGCASNWHSFFFLKLWTVGELPTAIFIDFQV